MTFPLLKRKSHSWRGIGTRYPFLKTTTSFALTRRGNCIGDFSRVATFDSQIYLDLSAFGQAQAPIRVFTRSENSIVVAICEINNVCVWSNFCAAFPLHKESKQGSSTNAEKGVYARDPVLLRELGAAHTRERIGVGICGTMHVARARHVINIRYRNSRLNSLNSRVSTCAPFERLAFSIPSNLIFILLYVVLSKFVWIPLVIRFITYIILLSS